MNEPLKVRVNDVEYVRADSVAPPSGDIKIVVLDRSYVYVGYVKIEEDFVVISNAMNVRIWGTKKGLGELASSGPLANTLLDKYGTVKAPLRALISLIDVEQGKWSSILR